LDGILAWRVAAVKHDNSPESSAAWKRLRRNLNEAGVLEVGVMFALVAFFVGIFAMGFAICLQFGSNGVLFCMGFALWRAAR
jgi:hypothetical protein